MRNRIRHIFLFMFVSGALVLSFGVGEVTTVEAGKFTFSYSSKDDTLVCRVSHGGSGWLGVGFGASKKMLGANFIVGNSNEAFGLVEDHYGVSPIKHQSDVSLKGTVDVYNASCTEKDGITTMSFSIPYDSKDKNDVIFTPKAPLKVIFAMGKDKSFARIHKDLGKCEITVPVY